jgi:4-amino-4-deoxy-L-arabinose transferase-like glycosyltransferase
MAVAGILVVALTLRLVVARAALVIETDGTRLIVIARQLRTAGHTFDPLFHPLYPAFTALAQPLVGDWEWAGRLVAVAAGTALIVLAYVLTRDVMGRGVALLTVALIAVHPGLVRSAASVLADSTYALLLATGACLGWRALTDLNRARFVLTAGVLALAYLVRPEAAVYVAGLLVGGLLVAWRRGRLRAWLAPLAAAVVTVGSVAGPYLVFLRRTLGHWTLSGKLAHNLTQDLGPAAAGMPLAHPGFLVRHIAENAFLFQKYAVPELFPGLLAFFVVPGLVAHARRPDWPAREGALLALALPALATLAFHVEGRVFFGVVAFVLPFAAAGLIAAGSWLGGARALRRTTLALTALVAVLLLPSTLASVVRPDRGARVYREAAAFVAASQPADAVLLDRKPFVAFYSGRRHALLADVAPADLAQAARRTGARLVVLDSRMLGDRPRLLPLVWSSVPPGFDLVRDFDVAPADRVRLLAPRASD